MLLVQCKVNVPWVGVGERTQLINGRLINQTGHDYTDFPQ